MKNRNVIQLLITLLWLGFYNRTCAQGSIEDDLRRTSETYFTPLRENVHLHLNKTVFYKGESVWFTAYVFDQTQQLPSFESTNLHVGLYDNSGNELARKLVLLENGVGSGDIELGEELEGDTFVIRAWTRYMKNFDELEEFEQIIHVGTAEPMNPISLGDPKLVVFPEGGHVIKDANNVIGYHLQYASPETVSQIELINSGGEVLFHNLGISKNGFGKVSYTPKGLNTYSLRLTLNDQTIVVQPLPEAEDYGVTLQIPRLESDNLKCVLSTNTATYKREQGNVFLLAIHQNARVFIEEVVLNSEVTRVVIPRDRLFNGVNTMSLFDTSLNLVSERMVYHNPETLSSNKELEINAQKNATGDSLLLSLASVVPRDSLTLLSLSMLPEESLADWAAHSLLTAFQIKPYSKIEYLRWRNLFEDEEGHFLSNDLDALMLLSGSGTYNWNRIRRGMPELLHPFDRLITMEGRIINSDPAKEKFGWFFTQNTGNGFYLEFDAQKSFKAQQVLFEGDSINISILGSRGKLREPKVEISFEDGVFDRKITPYSLGHSFAENSGSNQAQRDDLSLNTKDRVIALEEVVVEEKSNRSTVLPNLTPGVSGRIVTDRDVKSKVTLRNYLVSLGYRPYTYNGIVLFQMGSPIVNAPAIVVINGVPETGINVLNYPLNLVESVVYANSMYSSFISVKVSGRRLQNLREEYVTV